jgi:hypothetical protein
VDLKELHVDSTTERRMDLAMLPGALETGALVVI